MSDEKVQNPEVDAEATQETQEGQTSENQSEDTTNGSQQDSAQDSEQAQVVEPEVRIVEENIDYKDKYIRLSAEFDNYRKRTAKERIDTIKTASASLLEKLLPVADNFERAIKASEKATDLQSVNEGVTLIFNNFKEILRQQGLKEIDALHQDFDVDKHEAITQIPAPSEELKGKVVDVIEKGYILNERVIRYAKVVLGI